MDILASCTIQESIDYKGKLLIENEDGSKPDRVLLNLIVDDNDIGKLSSLNANTKCVTYIGNNFENIKDNIKIPLEKVFIEKPYMEGMELNTPSNMITLIRLPDGFSDMREVKRLCSLGENIRVIGGNLLGGIEGVRVGRYENKGTKDIVFNGIYDRFFEMPLRDISSSLKEIKKARKKLNDTTIKNSGSKKAKVSKPKVSNKMVKALSSLFNDSEDDF